MKTLTGILLFVMCGIFADGQTTAPKVVAAISAGTGSVVKGAPFSADAVSESVQVLADGNRITRTSTSRLYRNGEGRFRRESSAGAPGAGFGAYSMITPSTLILDPVAGYQYYLNDESKTVRAVSLYPTLAGTYKVAIAAQAAAAAGKYRAELGAARAAPPTPPTPATPSMPPTPPTPAVAATAPSTAAIALLDAASAAQGSGAFAFGFTAPGSGKTEELGTRNIEGVDAEGTRTVTTIEAGAIGNERPIEIVYEKWYSKELQLVVQSRHYDPRSGEQTYRLTNINRSEPDPSLFNLPAEYKLLTEPAKVYRTVSPKALIERAAPTRVITLSPAAKP